MPPYSSAPPIEYKSSFPELKYPSMRDHRDRTAERWLIGKKLDDNAEGLWRVHDKLYDVTGFLDKHPGGQEWLQLTKGTDITEAFEAHHITDLAPSLLPKYYVRDATGPRNSPYTFDENGFYRTLKRRVAAILPELKRKRTNISEIYADSMVCAIFAFAALAVRWQSFVFAVLSAIALTFNTVIAHNFFHKKDNFRMYYFNLSLMNYRDWRITHVISHHLHTNTLQDFEISTFEPYFQWLPKSKNVIVRYFPPIYAAAAYTLLIPMQLLRRIIRSAIGVTPIALDELLGLLIPLVMYILNSQPITNILFWYVFIVLVSSFHFGLIGLNAAHHHPHIFHDGDPVREERDWGLLQLDAVIDRPDINGNRFLVMTHFGEHALHHLFPTMDHTILPELLPIVTETCREFKVELRFKSQWELLVGQFKQLARVTPMKKPISAFYKKQV